MGFYACCSFDNNTTALNMNLYSNLDGAGFQVKDGLSTNSNPASLHSGGILGATNYKVNVPQNDDDYSWFKGDTGDTMGPAWFTSDVKIVTLGENAEWTVFISDVDGNNSSLKYYAVGVVGTGSGVPRQWIPTLWEVTTGGSPPTLAFGQLAQGSTITSSPDGAKRWNIRLERDGTNDLIEVHIAGTKEIDFSQSRDTGLRMDARMSVFTTNIDVGKEEANIDLHFDNIIMNDQTTGHGTLNGQPDVGIQVQCSQPVNDLRELADWGFDRDYDGKAYYVVSAYHQTAGGTAAVTVDGEPGWVQGLDFATTVSSSQGTRVPEGVTLYVLYASNNNMDVVSAIDDGTSTGSDTESDVRNNQVPVTYGRAFTDTEADWTNALIDSYQVLLKNQSPGQQTLQLVMLDVCAKWIDRTAKVADNLYPEVTAHADLNSFKHGLEQSYPKGSHQPLMLPVGMIPTGAFPGQKEE